MEPMSKTAQNVHLGSWITLKEFDPVPPATRPSYRVWNAPFATQEQAQDSARNSVQSGGAYIVAKIEAVYTGGGVREEVAGAPSLPNVRC
jgi:hypothetical protein